MRAPLPLAAVWMRAERKGKERQQSALIYFSSFGGSGESEAGHNERQQFLLCGARTQREAAEQERGGRVQAPDSTVFSSSSFLRSRVRVFGLTRWWSSLVSKSGEPKTQRRVLALFPRSFSSWMTGRQTIPISRTREWLYGR